MQQYVVLPFGGPSEESTQSNCDQAEYPGVSEQDQDADDGHNHAKRSGRGFFEVLDGCDVAHGVRLARHNEACIRDGHVSMLEKHGFARGPGLGNRCAQDFPELLIVYLHNRPRRTANFGRGSRLSWRLSIHKWRCR